MKMKANIPKELVLAAMDYLTDKQIGQGICFDIAETNHEAILRLEKGYTDDAQVYLTTGAVAKGDDHLVRHFLHSAPSMEKMKAWLQDHNNAEGIINSLQQLSGRVDEGFD